MTSGQNHDKFYVIKPISTKKYKHFCRKIYNKHRNKFIETDGDTVKINIPLLMNIIVDRLHKRNTHFIRHQYYNQMDYINGIIDVINNNTYWRRYKGLIPGDTLRKMHKKYCELGVYYALYRVVILIYFKDAKYEKLKDQTIDTTFIRNLYGTEMIQRNTEYKSKNGIKVSTQNDRNGVPISIAIAKGAVNDAKIAQEQLSYTFIDTDANKVKNNNKYKQNIFGDAQYDSRELLNLWKKKGYNGITDVNIRNTKDEGKLKALKKRKDKYLKLCKKRAIAETSFAWLHKYPKLDRYVEKTVESYAGLLLLGTAITVAGKIT